MRTSKFSKDAIKYGEQHSNLVLIDGDKMTELMYEFGIGVSTKIKIEIKGINNDYFETEEYWGILWKT